MSKFDEINSPNLDISFCDSVLYVTISNEIFNLMQERCLTKKQFADALGKKPSEVTKWLSGQHNFTVRTLAMLSTFFGQPLIQTCPRKYAIPDEEYPSMVAEETNS